jgi:hypothetical protein
VPLAGRPDDVAAVVERTAGVTASFLKELVRRAGLESLTERPGALGQVTGAHLSRRSTTCSTAPSPSPGRCSASRPTSPDRRRPRRWTAATAATAAAWMAAGPGTWSAFPQ